MNLPRIKLAIVLPIAQILLASILVWIGERHSHRSLELDWQRAAESFCDAVNAPAERIVIILWRITWWPGGVFSYLLLYLPLIGALWYLVGRKLDAIRFPAHGAAQLTPIRIAGNLVAVLYGIYLLIVSCLNNVLFSRSLWFLWSLVFIFVPGITLVQLLRRKPGQA